MAQSSSSALKRFDLGNVLQQVRNPHSLGRWRSRRLRHDATPIMIFLNERFPTEIRASGTGVAWNAGFALGGMMPTFVSLANAAPSQIPMSLSIFVVVIFLAYLFGALLIPETKGDFR
jgi:hypothetical protein